MKTITMQPLSCQFSNENKKMGLRPHQHFATVQLTCETTGALGFPVFAETVAAVHGVLTAATERPFRDSTNEDVADALFALFEDLLTLRMTENETGLETGDAWPRALAVLQGWGGEYRLCSLKLAVRGVPDDIGHSDGFAEYTVTR